LKARGTSRVATSNTETLATMLTESISFQHKPCITEESVEASHCKPFAMESVLSALLELHQFNVASLSPPTHYRVILVWNHSSSAPSFSLPPPLPSNHPRPSSLMELTCTIDALFLHSKPNKQEEADLLHSIFSTLDAHCQRISSSVFLPTSNSSNPKSFYTIGQEAEAPPRPSSYIYEASLHSPAAVRRVLASFVQLMTPAHLRPPQNDLPSAPTDLASLPLPIQVPRNNPAVAAVALDRTSISSLNDLSTNSDHLKGNLLDLI
jgi:hypothetical protein